MNKIRLRIQKTPLPLEQPRMFVFYYFLNLAVEIRKKAESIVSGQIT